MRIVKAANRTSFSPPNIQAKVTILGGKEKEHGDLAKHTVAIVQLNPGQKLDQHFHREREESYLVLSGHGTITVDSTVVAISVGDFVSVYPGEQHEIQAAQNNGLEYLVITAPSWTLDDVHRSKS